jgi:hypothetical protein
MNAHKILGECTALYSITLEQSLSGKPVWIETCWIVELLSSYLADPRALARILQGGKEVGVGC